MGASSRNSIRFCESTSGFIRLSMIKADKNFGQHFLINIGIIEKISEEVLRLARQLNNLHVVEIGPGPGALTESLLKKGLSVTAVELDERMIEELKNKFSNAIETKQLTLMCKDACRLIESELGDSYSNKPYVVCGNLPYNVGTTIVFHSLENLPNATSFVYMLQKEVIQRLKAEPGSKSYGIPSIKLAWCIDVLNHFWVSAGSFSPPPRVESGIIVYRRKTRENCLADARERNGLYDSVSSVVNRLFQTRRKMIGSTIRELRDNPNAKKRPEELAPSEFISLHVAMKESLTYKTET